MSDANLPIALRPAVDFLPVRDSIFDDPGDEKSWHASQRSESLYRFYEGRDPSWYASAIAPLAGADRVLDLGCGPGLTLEALLEQGCSSVLGIDRWPAFTANSKPVAPIVAHDLTLPMPFLESGSFDGVLSHYALDYVSPIGMRQVLREARRLLAPGGRLLIYVAAVGLGSGDEARTVAYSPGALRVLLDEAGFDEIDVEASPNGRNSIAQARRAADDADVQPQSQGGVRASIDGDTQLSASFFSKEDRVKLAISNSVREVVVALEPEVEGPPGGARISICARACLSASGGTELQLWVWRGCVPLVSETVRLEFAATDIRVVCPGNVEHVSAWFPSELSIEAPGNAYVSLSQSLPPEGLSEAERGAEGRRIVIEAAGGGVSGIDDWLGPGRNRFFLRQASRLDALELDREWLAGRTHGILTMAQELDGERMRDLLLWAGWRQALVFLGGVEWDDILLALGRRRGEMNGPVALVDPALCGDGEAQAVPAQIATVVEESSMLFVLLSAGSRETSSPADLQRLSRRLLHGGPSCEKPGIEDATETLRHLTERTLLMRMRQVHGRSAAEIGRRPVAR